MAQDSINNIICDNILRKFKGSKCISRDKVRQAAFYANIDDDLNVVEHHIDFLIRDRTLKEDDNVISLTMKGWFMLNNAEKVGYVAQRIDDVLWQKSERDTRLVVRWTIFIALGVTSAWAIYRLLLMV